MKFRWIVLLFIAVLAVANFADKSIIGLSAVHIMEDMDLSYNQWGIVSSSFYWLFSIVGVIGASLSDKYGTEKMIGIMVIIWTLSQSMVFFITSLPMLIFSRVLLGLGEGPFFATAISHISKWFPMEKRGLAISILNVGNVAGKAITAPLLVFIIATFHWRIAFLVMGVSTLVWFMFWIWIGRKNPPKEVAQEDVPQAKEKFNWRAIRAEIMTPTFIVTTIIMFICYGLIAFRSSFMPAFYVDVKNIADTNMSYMIAIGGLLGAILSVGLSFVSDKIYGKTKNMRKSHVLLPTILLVFSGILHFIMPYLYFEVSFTIISIFENAIILLLFTLLPQVVNSLMPEKRGTMSGVCMGVATTAGIVVPIILGKIIDVSGTVTQGYTIAIQLIGVLMVVSAFIFFMIAKPDRKAIKVLQNQEVATETS